jgi:hypothetical protein
MLPTFPAFDATYGHLMYSGVIASGLASLSGATLAFLGLLCVFILDATQHAAPLVER